MHVVEHLVNAQNLGLLLFLSLHRFDLTVEFLAVDLAEDVHSFDNAVHALGLFVINAVKEKSVAPLKQVRAPSFIIMLHQFISKWLQFVVCFFLNSAEAESVIGLPLIIEIGPFHVSLKS